MHAGYTLGNDQLCRVWNLIPEGPADICTSIAVSTALVLSSGIQDLRFFSEGRGRCTDVASVRRIHCFLLLNGCCIRREERIKSSAQARRQALGIPRQRHSGRPSAGCHRCCRRKAHCSEVRRIPDFSEAISLVLSFAASGHHLSGCHIVKTADQGDQTGFCTSGRTDDTDRLAGTDVKCDILKHRLGAVLFIGKIDVREGDAAVSNLMYRNLPDLPDRSSH